MKNVTILGAGLVGSLLSIYLSKRGYTVEIYERRPDMRKEKIVAGRSINLALSDRGWRGLEGAGLKEEIQKVAIPMAARMIHNVDGTTMAQPYGKENQAINSVSRGGLNMSLIDLAEQQKNVSIHFNQRCDSVDLKRKKIFFTDEKGKQSEKNYDLIFGADGAFSALRNSMHYLDRFDYSQNYIEHGYKEFTIPAGENGIFQVEKNALHIWPRKSFMLIALPNMDGSFTCTLFFPFDGNVSFSKIKTEKDVEDFFTEYFPDAKILMPTYKKDFFNNPTSSLVTVRCFPWSFEDSACLIGDAAHAVVPFFGQGMNCGFEDCVVLNELMEKHNDDWKKILPEFQLSRKANADAIAQMALNNFIEMRDLVADPHFLLKKKIEKKLSQLLPDIFVPAYTMVTFSPEIPYAEAMRRGNLQNEILEELAAKNNWEEIIELDNILSEIKNKLTA